MRPGDDGNQCPRGADRRDPSSSSSPSPSEAATTRRRPVVYDLAIVGRGMIGSAAARHAARFYRERERERRRGGGGGEVGTGKGDDGDSTSARRPRRARVALVGPPEIPKDRRRRHGPRPPPAEEGKVEDDGADDGGASFDGDARGGDRDARDGDLMDPRDLDDWDDWDWDESTVYGSHYDEGRIYRCTDPDPVWAELARRSILRYGEIEAEASSGTFGDGDDLTLDSETSGGGGGNNSFFVECGHLAVGPRGGGVVESRLRNARSMGVKVERLTSSSSSSLSLEEVKGGRDGAGGDGGGGSGGDSLCPSSSSLEDRFPYLRFPPGGDGDDDGGGGNEYEGAFEPRGAGYISARGLAEAQTRAAVNGGYVDVLSAVVAEVTREEGAGRDGDDDGDGGDGDGCFVLRMEKVFGDGGNPDDAPAEEEEDEVVDSGGGRRRHHIVRARRVLVAAGAFCNARPLLPSNDAYGEGGGRRHLLLDVTAVKTQTVHFVLSDGDAGRLTGGDNDTAAMMPSVIFKNDDMWAYVLPPIRYPDGTVRLKLGGARRVVMQNPDDDVDGDEERGEAGRGVVRSESERPPVPDDRVLKTTDDLVDWYRTRSGDDPAGLDEMESMLHGLVPDLAPLRVVGDVCAALHTPTGRAYVGEVPRVGSDLAVATGGNGYAAKSSDELGRLGVACLLCRGEFNGGEEVICGMTAADVFRPRFLGG